MPDLSKRPVAVLALALAAVCGAVLAIVHRVSRK